MAAATTSSVVACLVLGCLMVPFALSAPLSGWMAGTASFFGGSPDQALNAFNLTMPTGSCGYGSIDPRLFPFYNVVGLQKNNSIVRNRPQHGCGVCLEVSCTDTRGICYPTAPIMAVVTDECNENCTETSLNIHVFGFETLAPIRFGRVDIKYRQVECEPADNIVVRVSDYRVADEGWIRLSLKNVAGDAGVSKVEFTTSKIEDSDKERYDVWRPMENTFGANWEYSHLPALPFDIRVTNTLGQQVILKKIITVAGGTGEFESKQQFPLRSSSSGMPNPTTTKPSNITLTSNITSTTSPDSDAAIDVMVPPSVANATNITKSTPRANRTGSPAGKSANGTAPLRKEEPIVVVQLATEPSPAPKLPASRKVAPGGGN